MTTSSRSPAWTSRIAHAWTSAPSTASTRWPSALHPSRGVRGLRCMRARVPDRGHLLRGRPASEWSDYLRANVDFFNDLGSPGGAQKTGVQDFDDPMIAACRLRMRTGRPKTSDSR